MESVRGFDDTLIAVGNLEDFSTYSIGGASMVRCRQCSSNNLTSLGDIPDGAYFAGHKLNPPWSGGNLYKCGACMLVMRSPLQDEAEYLRLYKTASPNVWKSSTQRRDQRLVRDAILAIRSSGRVLDVGCYDGGFLDLLPDTFERFGIEASAAATECAKQRGIDVLSDRIESLAECAMQFEVITAIDVMEHVANPIEFLETLSACAVPGGIIVISTGRTDTLAWRVAGGQYWYCQIAEHISFICREWAQRASASVQLTLQSVESFHYHQSDSKTALWVRQLKFARQISPTFFKRALQRLGLIRRQPREARHVFGYPGLFADHVLIVFRKP